jgi:hypothetical protein
MFVLLLISAAIAQAKSCPSPGESARGARDYQLSEQARSFTAERSTSNVHRPMTEEKEEETPNTE